MSWPFLTPQMNMFSTTTAGVKQSEHFEEKMEL